MLDLFLDQKHEDRFFELRSKMKDVYQTNKEYLSVIFLLAANEELQDKINPYFNTHTGKFDSIKMFEEKNFRSDIGVLAHLAVHLFNNKASITPLNLVDTLDEHGFKLALNAIHLRRFGVGLEYKEKKETFYL